VNPEAAGLVNPAQEQLKTAVVQTQQGANENAAAEAAQLAANAKLGALAALHKQHPLKGLPEIAANPGITSNTGYVLG
jgi:HEPN domain-containing protein